MKRLLIIAISLAALVANAQVSEKFLKQAAEKVWAMDMPEFNPYAEIPDSVSDGQSTVMIAAYYGIDAKLIQNQSLTKAVLTGLEMVNSIKSKQIRRFMVKILDDDALENYSTFSFGKKKDFEILGLSLYSKNSAFGARIHKKDGTKKDVDLTEAFKVGEGKKGDKDASMRIAIPDLEIGDVIEYFYYDEEECDEIPLPVIEFSFVQEYPILNFKIEGAFDNGLTVEYRNMNGAPQYIERHNENGRNYIDMELTNLPAVYDDDYTNTARQVPYSRIAVSNSSSRYLPDDIGRRAGLYGDIPAATFLWDRYKLMCKRYNKENPLIGKSKSLVKEFRKQHPDADSRTIADAAYLALLYNIVTIKNIEASPSELCMYLRQILNDLKLDNTAHLGLINPRSSAFINDIIEFSEPNPVVVFGDALYQFDVLGNYMPGETPKIYQGETGVVFKNNEANDKSLMDNFEAQFVDAKNNSFTTKIRVAFDDDMETLLIHRDNTAKGAKKGMVDLPQDDYEFIASIEKYLGIPEKKRYEPKNYDAAKREDERKENIEKELINFLGVAPKEYSNFKVESYGNLPGEPAAVYSIDCKVETMVDDMSDEIFINVGKLFSNRARIEGRSREHNYAAFLPSTSQYRYDMVVEIPEGYEVVPESLEDLSINLTNPLGKVFCMAEVNDEGNVAIQFFERVDVFVIPEMRWKAFLELDDTASSITEKSIILRRK